MDPWYGTSVCVMLYIDFKSNVQSVKLECPGRRKRVKTGILSIVVRRCGALCLRFVLGVCYSSRVRADKSCTDYKRICCINKLNAPDVKSQKVKIAVISLWEMFSLPWPDCTLFIFSSHLCAQTCCFPGLWEGEVCAALSEPLPNSNHGAESLTSNLQTTSCLLWFVFKWGQHLF